MTPAERAATKNSTNPKDSLGVLKVQFGVCPQLARVYWAMAMQDGATKYGEMNWRKKKVKISVYLDAIDRHLAALRAGEDLDGPDPISGVVVPHSGRIMACLSIIEDARASGNLIDDRRAGDTTAGLLKTMTHQDYTTATLAVTRTPADTLDETRGGPFDFQDWAGKLKDGQQALNRFRAERDKAVEDGTRAQGNTGAGRSTGRSRRAGG